MGMNELGPRRCPFAFVSVILKNDVITKNKAESRRSRYRPGENGWSRKASKERATSVLRILNSVGLISG